MRCAACHGRTAIRRLGPCRGPRGSTGPGDRPGSVQSLPQTSISELVRAGAGLGGKGGKTSEESPRCHETCIFLLKRSNIDLNFIHRSKLCIFTRKYRFKLCIFTAVQHRRRGGRLAAWAMPPWTGDSEATTRTDPNRGSLHRQACCLEWSPQ